jgi:predicted DNA-binding transcriptional regulator AlpA
VNPGDELRMQAKSVAEADRLLRATEVAAILGVRLKRVYELGIPCVRLSARSLRWQRGALAVWIEERRSRA